MNIIFDVEKDPGFPAEYPLEAVTALRSMALYIQNTLSIISAEIEKEEESSTCKILIHVIGEPKHISIMGYSDILTAKINYYLSEIDRSELWSQADAAYWERLS